MSKSARGILAPMAGDPLPSAAMPDPMARDPDSGWTRPQRPSTRGPDPTRPLTKPIPSDPNIVDAGGGGEDFPLWSRKRVGGYTRFPRGEGRAATAQRPHPFPPTR